MPIERMDSKTHVVRYVCEECEAYYATESEAVACEESHAEEEHAH